MGSIRTFRKFNDPMIDNKDSKIRYRADKLIEDYMQNEKGDKTL